MVAHPIQSSSAKVAYMITPSYKIGNQCSEHLDPFAEGHIDHRTLTWDLRDSN